MMVSRLIIFAALIMATIPHMVGSASFNRVPSGPRDECPTGWIPARGALPTRLNECAILNRARHSPMCATPPVGDADERRGNSWRGLRPQPNLLCGNPGLAARLVRADGAARLRRSTAPSADICDLRKSSHENNTLNVC